MIIAEVAILMRVHSAFSVARRRDPRASLDGEISDGESAIHYLRLRGPTRRPETGSGSEAVQRVRDEGPEKPASGAYAGLFPPGDDKAKAA
ncbi:MAG: hypothetical protein AB7O57_15290 [Hyphomicrobiaceae bacterium]